jgi:hypothetical protein
MIRPRNPRAEASALLGDGYEARVLEPSPPAVDDGDWYADDPTDPAGAAGTVVSPVGTGAGSWSELAERDPAIAEFAADNWLGAYRRLDELPEGFAAQREDFHRVAFHVLSVAREEATGKIGLRYTKGGFGTPFFGADRQVRIEGTRLVVQQGDAVESRPLSTLNDAAGAVGVTYDPARAERFDAPRVIDGDQPLRVGEETATALADWFGFGFSVLEELRRHGRPEDAPGRVQLWPEHFDAALELGDSQAGRRAGYGASPGDAAHPEPYLYVAAWGPVDRAEPFWNDDSFNGASLSYRELLSAPDQRRAALEFALTGLRILTRA